MIGNIEIAEGDEAEIEGSSVGVYSQHFFHIDLSRLFPPVPPSKHLLCLSNEDWSGGSRRWPQFWSLWCLGCRFPIRLRLWRSKTCHSSVKSHKLPGPLFKCSFLYEFNSHEPPFIFWIFCGGPLHGHIFPFMVTSSGAWPWGPALFDGNLASLGVSLGIAKAIARDSCMCRNVSVCVTAASHTHAKSRLLLPHPHLHLTQ